jgi:ABC-type transport system involved in cytochrome c biogenesis permease subunit
MPRLEAVLLLATFALYAAGFALALGGLVSGRERPYRLGRWAALGGLAAHSLAIAARTVISGHFPIVTPYENASVGGWSIVLLTFVAPRRLAVFRAAGVGAVALALLILGWAVTEDVSVTPFAASVRSSWLYVHVTFAFLAYGAFSIASGASLAYLVRARRGGPSWLPPLEQLDRVAYLYLVFGFITCAVMIGAGAIWAKDLWGTYWAWDPVETWNLVAWLTYGLLIHLRVTYGWRDERFAWFALVAVGLIVIAYFGVDLFLKGSRHVFTVPIS